MVEGMKAVKLISVTDKVEADLILNLLQNNSIPCFKKDNFTGSYMNIYMGYSVFGEEIFVDEADYEQAKAILSEIYPETVPEAEDITEMNSEKSDSYSEVPFYQNPKIVARIILVTMLGGLLLIFLLAYIANP